MTTPTSTPGSNIEVDLRAKNPRTFDVSEDYVLEAREGAIPDTGLDHLYWGPAATTSNWPDSIGSEDATSNGSPSLTDINGTQAVSFDNSTEYVTSNPLSLGSSNAYTFVFVVEAVDNGEALNTVLNDGDGNGYAFFYDFVDNDYNHTHTSVDSPDGGGSLTTDPVVGVGSFDGSTFVLDINGAPALNYSISNPNTPTASFSIGSRGDSDYFEGKIGAIGHEAAFADSTRRDGLTNTLAYEFGITI